MTNLRLHIGRLCPKSRAAIFNGPVLVEKFNTVTGARERLRELQDIGFRADKKYCNKCETWLTTDNFVKNKKKHECDTCVRARMKKYYYDNKEDISAYQKAYYKVKVLEKTEIEQKRRQRIKMSKQFNQSELPKGNA